MKKLRRKNNRCRRGHLVEGDNARTLPDGRIVCRACIAQNARDYYKRKIGREPRPYIKEKDL